ncbi:unnamed protein product [Protopolystoma xenopodis]|uniref:Uncharacterized protein n=1 Tax=Protopolystoma xenopodis TaxID=117903 RepID=A0A3S5BHX5_9PLAT|nr:unnamed protein product [Protopolystoma xenopodis]
MRRKFLRKVIISESVDLALVLPPGTTGAAAEAISTRSTAASDAALATAAEVGEKVAVGAVTLPSGSKCAPNLRYPTSVSFQSLRLAERNVVVGCPSASRFSESTLTVTTQMTNSKEHLDADAPDSLWPRDASHSEAFSAPAGRFPANPVGSRPSRAGLASSATPSQAPIMTGPAAGLELRPAFCRPTSIPDGSGLDRPLYDARPAGRRAERFVMATANPTSSCTPSGFAPRTLMRLHTFDSATSARPSQEALLQDPFSEATALPTHTPLHPTKSSTAWTGRLA